MIQTLSHNIALYLKKNNPHHPASVEVLTYSLASVINIVGTIVLSLTTALLLGQIEEVIWAMAAFAVLRAMSGGYHLNSSIVCMLVTSIVANLVPLISQGIPDSSGLFYGIVTISVILVALFATNHIEHQTRIPKRYFPYLRVAAALLVASNYWIHSEILSVTFLIQSILLVKIGGDSK